jgi:quercetin dioxygenase-like cupin family protein
VFVHEDHRRKLIEFGSGPFAVCKALVAKAGCVVGDHHHRHKDEAFLLLSGHARLVVVGERQWRDVQAPCVWEVPRGTYHLFDLREGSILIGTASAEFDPADEIGGRP